MPSGLSELRHSPVLPRCQNTWAGQCCCPAGESNTCESSAAALAEGDRECAFGKKVRASASTDVLSGMVKQEFYIRIRFSCFFSDVAGCIKLSKTRTDTYQPFNAGLSSHCVIKPTKGVLLENMRAPGPKRSSHQLPWLVLSLLHV